MTNSLLLTLVSASYNHLFSNTIELGSTLRLRLIHIQKEQRPPITSKAGRLGSCQHYYY